MKKVFGGDEHYVFVRGTCRFDWGIGLRLGFFHMALHSNAGRDHWVDLHFVIQKLESETKH